MQSIWKIKIIGDTVMPNGKRYYVFGNSTDWISGQIAYSYCRIDDSLNVRAYGNFESDCDYEYLILKLDVPDTTIWKDCRHQHPSPENNFPCLSRTELSYHPKFILTK